MKHNSTTYEARRYAKAETLRRKSVRKVKYAETLEVYK